MEETRYHKLLTDFDQEEKTMYVPAYMEEQVSQAKAEGIQLGKAEGIQLGKAEGKAEGIQIGEAKGHKQGEADMLLNLLTLKFKSIPNDIREKINQADEIQLTEWAKKIFAAHTIEEIFQ